MPINLKEYPKTVVLRKSLVLVAILVFSLIALLIIYNLYHSEAISRPSASSSSNALPQMASVGDVEWYQKATIQKVAASLAQPNHSPQFVILKPKYEAPLSQVKNNGSENLEKAMQAPINSNQITGNEVSNPVSMGSEHEAHSSEASSPQALNDPNQQVEKIQFLQSKNEWLNQDTLDAQLKKPASPFEIQAGTVIPGILITGINSDLPGQITAQVRSNVYDSVSGRSVLIPQGAKLTGLYDSQVVYGQKRALVVWKRILFPNGMSLNLEGMPGVDLSGYAGFKDQVNNHYGTLFGSVLLMSVLASGAQLSQPQNSNMPFVAPTVSQTLAQSLGTNLSNTGAALLTKNLNIQPTLQIRPGYLFNITVTKDIDFPTPYFDSKEDFDEKD